MDVLALNTDAGHRLLARYHRTQNSSDLDQSINHFECASDLCPMDHPCCPAALFNLATANFLSCQAEGRHLDLDIPINLFQEALDLRPSDHPDRTRPATSMLQLSPNQLALRAERCLQRDEPRALDEVISLHYDALGYYNSEHACRGQLLGILAVMLITRFERRGNEEDLDQAIALQSEVLALCPVGHTDRSISLHNLTTQLSCHFEHRGKDEDLDQAITLQMEALALFPVGHADRSKSLNNLAIELSSRFEHRGNYEDLNQAIALDMEALALRPVGHADRSMSLNNLAIRLSTCFEYRGNVEELDQAIALQTEALALRPVGHTERSKSLNNLANQLSFRFERRGNVEDLDQAITLDREALGLCPVGHADWSKSLGSLANRLSSHFEHRGNDEDLNQAIILNKEALALLPVGHTDWSMSSNNLATQLSTRFEHRGNNEDLNQAIALNREALASRLVSHTDWSMSLNNLANQLSSRFQHRGNDKDLDQAIALHREALALRPVDHADRSKSLSNLANQLSIRFLHRGNREDLDESRENLCCALTLLTQHDPRQLIVLESLADVHLSFHRSGLDSTGAGEDTDSLNVAMHHLNAAANVVSAGLLSHLRASLRWVRHARQHSHDTELEAHATSMQLLDAYMSTTASILSRHNIMKDFPSTLAVDAASCALRSGDVCRAVELLEQGRTIIWTQMTRLRTPLDSLQTCDDRAAALIKKFRDLSSLLDKPSVNDREATPRVNVEAEETRYRCLVKDWNGTVEEICKIEGFSHFLLPPLFSDLQDAAHDGPIIVLITSELSCDAIIIPHKQPPTKIPLPTNLEKLQTLAARLQHRSTPALTTALTELWDEVVRLVVENLGGFARPGSQIWWCPMSVFNFLPLHAAGQYWKDGQFLSQFYISSYTPLLIVLIKARRHNRSLSVSFAAIGQDHPAGASHTLECVEPELELVRSLLPPPPTVSFTKITSVDATKSRALCALQENTWLHFLCHGTQNFDEPFNSAFLMRDRPLSLLDITQIQMDLSQHQFAFLSACETAVGDFKTPDEVIHLAAGLQFVGVKSVVGTLWTVDDDTVQCLVEAFYKNFCGDGKMNSKRAARALHKAVQSLACDKDMSLEQRIVFVHIGI
ncbi:CHAT domain-containing protein [Suillus subalutaceus]|uniref:CHAT domain-containing protein n=1 Tax=Suillus subalutaceus TaxID=48586 RepID=UPI001B864C60|nr:CHAT domain-containing protein [Suillus subalutaceus]KAG1848060.1 CHAT domain-containing protein [Suillus subalutaceus]